MIMHLKCKFVLIALAALFVLSSDRVAKAQSAPSCTIKHQRSALVTKVLKNGILQLGSGELVRLIGVMPVKQFGKPTSTIAKKLKCYRCAGHHLVAPRA